MLYFRYHKEIFGCRMALLNKLTKRNTLQLQKRSELGAFMLRKGKKSLDAQTLKGLK